MSDPAVEAAQRALGGMPLLVRSCNEQPVLKVLVMDVGTSAAREALKPIRELHRPVNAHGTGRIVCGVCWDSMSNYMHWPCATARLVYSGEELS